MHVGVLWRLRAQMRYAPRALRVVQHLANGKMTTELLLNLGFALLGGVILNVMPCVLPVLTMKVFHLMEHNNGDAKARHRHGLAYAAGVLTTFLILAALVVGLRASGERVGWGMQFQHPPFVATMVALIFAFGLNSLGVFEWNLSLSGRPKHQGYAASYFNGIFAAVMSTPCSAPFLGSAALFALGSGAQWYETVALFTMIGIGLALPFLLVSYIPGVGKLLPRPGPWMEVFKSLMGFTLLAAAIWLYGVLQAQIARDAATLFLAFLLVLAIALWSIHHFGGVLYGTARRVGVRTVAIGVTALAGNYMISFEKPAQPKIATAALAAAAGAQAPAAAKGREPVVVNGHLVWTDFDPARIEVERKKKRPVFVDYTADWCANCKTNERVSIETDQVRKAFETSGVLPMKADWTNQDDTIGDWLNKLGRSGIPAYAIYMPDGSFDLLPEGLVGAEVIAKALTNAAAKYPPAAQVALQ